MIADSGADMYYDPQKAKLAAEIQSNLPECIDTLLRASVCLDESALRKICTAAYSMGRLDGLLEMARMAVRQ
jgi:hypothetical protein